MTITSRFCFYLTCDMIRNRNYLQQFGIIINMNTNTDNLIITFLKSIDLSLKEINRKLDSMQKVQIKESKQNKKESESRILRERLLLKEAMKRNIIPTHPVSQKPIEANNTNNTPVGGYESKYS